MAGKLPTPPSATAPATRAHPRGSAASVEATPTVAGSPTGAPPPTVRAEPGYYLVAHPDRWGVIAGQVVPMCTKLALTPGVNAMDADARGNPSPRMAIAGVETRGGKVIPWDIDGPGTSYLRKVPGTGSWISRWETQFSGSSVVASDAKGYAAWLRGLIERGILFDPPGYALEALIEQMGRNIERYEERGADKNGAKIARIRADLAVVRAELERVSTLAEVATAEAVPEVV